MACYLFSLQNKSPHVRALCYLRRYLGVRSLKSRQAERKEAGMVLICPVLPLFLDCEVLVVFFKGRTKEFISLILLDLLRTYLPFDLQEFIRII